MKKINNLKIKDNRKIKCAYCDNLFSPIFYREKYCSLLCKNRAKRIRLKETIKKWRIKNQNKIREKAVKYQKKWRLKNIEECRRKDREGKVVLGNCIICKKEIKGYKVKKYCNVCRKDLQKKNLVGNDYWKKVKRRLTKENHPNWKGGITFWKKRIWDSKKYKDWRRKVFERDNYTCQNCGEKGYLEAHHTKSFTELLKKYNIKSKEEADLCNSLWNIRLGQTLCFKCHNNTKNGRKTKPKIYFPKRF